MRFTDTKGREWTIKFDFQTLCQIEDELGYPIMEDPTSLPTKAKAYVEMAWFCIEEQAEKAGVTPEDFGKSIDGKVFDDIQKGILEELAVFFEAPRPGASALIRKAVELVEKGNQLQLQAVEKALDGVSSELLERLGLSHGVSQPGN
jgi:hypothetical protein